MPRPVEYDFTGTARGGFHVFPEGNYLLKVDKVYDTDKEGMPLVSGKGHPQLRVKFAVVGAPPGLEDEIAHTITDFFTMTPAALWRWRMFLEAATQRELNKALKFDLDLLEAKQPVVQARLYNETFNNVERTKIGEYTAATMPAPKPAPKAAPTAFPEDESADDVPDVF